MLYAAWNAGPVYFNDFQFGDTLNEIARTPRQRNVETVVTERLEKAIREFELSDMIKLEVLSDPQSLLPDPIATLEATKRLVKDGFTVPAM